MAKQQKSASVRPINVRREREVTPRTPSRVTSEHQAAVAAEAIEWAQMYRPVAAGRRDERAVVFTREVAQTLASSHGFTVDQLKKSLPTVFRFAAWAQADRVKLTVSSLFDPFTIGQFAVASERQYPGSAATWQSTLRRVGAVLCPRAPWENPAPVAKRGFIAPYSAADITKLEADVAANAPFAQRAGETYLVLGLGAGLDGRHAHKVTGADVVDHGTHLTITVPGTTTEVVVRRAYEERLRALVASAEPGEFLTGSRAKGKNAASELAKRIVLAPGTPALQLVRLRNTWIVAHLSAGTPLKVLAEQAGVQGATTFSDLLAYVEAPTAQAAVSAMRGA